MEDITPSSVFADVKNVKHMENRIDGTMVRGTRLDVNLALHKRKELPSMTKKINSNPSARHNDPFTNKKPAQGVWGRPRDHRTFAKVLGKKTHSHTAPPPPPPIPPHIALSKNTENWIWKTSLMGEAMSLDHLGHMPKLLSFRNDILMEIKYVGEGGGLKVLLQFNDSVTAKEFKDNKQRWQEHLKWVDWAEKIDREFDRVAWIRIVGLPIHLWGERNFSKITEGYGVTISPFDELPNRVDLSCVKIGILTKRRTRINDEIFVSCEGKFIKLGIIEFDEDWFPFKFDHSEDYYEKDDLSEVDETDEENEDEEGVSDTWMHEDGGEMEEGEISPFSVVREEPLQGDRSPETEKSVGAPVKSTMSIRANQETPGSPQRMETYPRESGGPPHDTLSGIVGNSIIPSHQFCDEMIGATNVITTPPPKAHMNNLVNGLPHGCFGPFPSHNINGSSYIQVQKKSIPGSLGKRKRYDISGSDFPLTQ
ncbi:unnamed protein product [Lactuca saligna]|uniref:DUF4283 domain-containing protein n=1 Tax=Lactuca saligna TaxID=75948 RepID=A0AA35YB12_LACSI|nr:unnamed protein product [Lactuca saligna]